MTAREPSSTTLTWTSERGDSLFVPPQRLAEGFESAETPTLPPDLREQARRRLRLIAAAYSTSFLMLAFLPDLVMGLAGGRFQLPVNWPVSLASIAIGVVVAGFATHHRLSWGAWVNLGLAFQIAGSFAIAVSEYSWMPREHVIAHLPHASLSWVAVWMVFYAAVVPAPPGRALAALVASALSVPLVIGFELVQLRLQHMVSPVEFFFRFVFPQAVCVGLGYVGARVVYRLGKDVSRARELGSYRLIEPLGRGGMGEVWRASHRMLARPAAIKFIRAEHIAKADAQARDVILRRFELEARTTAALTSEHTIDLYDFGITPDGTFYYVMELLDGLDCERLVRRFGALAPARLAHLLAQVCASLDEAHARGLIHRDVKPANVFVCRSGNRYDFVKVLDFGLVALRRSQEDGDGTLTLPHQAVGTPAYMAPEMATGGAIDGRTDLYAVGCLAYWLATGRAPFRGNSVYDVVSQHLQSPPEPPSAHAPHPLPPELDTLILRCLEKDPDRRPQSARELGRCLRTLPLAEPWGDEEAEAWWAAPRPTPAP